MLWLLHLLSAQLGIHEPTHHNEILIALYLLSGFHLDMLYLQEIIGTGNGENENLQN